MNTIVGWKRFLIGGLGGLAPVAALLLAVDFEKYFAEPISAKVFGYGVRVIVLFAIGGLVAWLHENEDKLFKLFEIGLGAPALIAGLVTTNSLVVGVPTKASAAGVAEAVVFSLLPSANAQGNSGPSAKQSSVGSSAPQFSEPQGATQVVRPQQVPVAIKKFRAPSAGSQFLEGFIGVAPARSWYVTAGSYARQEDAIDQAATINALNKGLKAEVFAPSASGKQFDVVLGSELKKGEANTLRDKAISAGVAENAYVKASPGQ